MKQPLLHPPAQSASPGGTRPRLWIAPARPDNLVNALAVAAAGRDRFASCHLVREDSGWWKKVDLDGGPAWFDEVHLIGKVTACRGLRDLPRFYRALQRRQQALLDLRIAPGDVIVVLAGIMELGAALASAYPGVRKLLGVAVKKYVDANRPYSVLKYRPTTSGWLRRRVLEPWLGMERTVHLKPWRGQGDGVRLDRLEKPVEEVFEGILLLSNDGTEKPPDAGPNVYPSPFPALHDLDGWRREPSARESNPSGTVVFFGTPFLLVRNLPPRLYAARLNECLEALRRWYGPTCELVYRPHPAETDEQKHLDLRGFAYDDDRQVAELYFLRDSRRIRAVFSVSSTVARVALNYGLNSYALWRCFPFDATAQEYFRSLMGRVPPEFEIRSLDSPPVAYAGLSGGTAQPVASFQGVVQSIFARWQPPLS